MIKQRDCTNSIGIVNWKSFLTDVNISLNNFWTLDEINSVSRNLSCNPLQNLGEIFDYGLLKPVARKISSIETIDPIIKDPIIKDPIIKVPIIKVPIIKDPIIKDPIIKDPIIKDPIIKDPIIKVPIIKYYSLRNYEPDQGILYSTKLFDGNFLSIQETNEIIVFVPTLIAPNKRENINQILYETFLIKDKTNDYMLSATGYYFDETTSLISSIDGANYVVNGGTGIYEGAKKVNIEFFKDKDLLRKVTIFF